MQEIKQKNEKEDVLKLVKDTKKELADYRKQFEKNWKEYDDAYYGKQHKTGENKKTVKNHIFKIVETMVPILTDSMPGTLVTANKTEQQEAADALEKAIRWVYNDQSLQLKLPSVVRSSLISAPGYLTAFYNPDADGGDGKIEIKQIDWDSVYLDGASQEIQYATKAVFEVPMRRSEVIRRWPEKKEQLQKTQNEKTSSYDDGNFEKRDISGTDNVMGKPSKSEAKDILTYRTTWLKSYDLEDIPQEETQEELVEEYTQLSQMEAPSIKKWENHDAHMQTHMAQRGELLVSIGLDPNLEDEALEMAIGQLAQANPEANLTEVLLAVKIIDNHLEEHEELKKLNPTGQRPLYKDGWRVIESCGDVVCYDGPNPEQNGRINLVPFYAYKDTTIYGLPEVKNIIGPQRTLNEMDFSELESLRVSSNPGWIADNEAEIDENQLTNEPGLVVKKKRGTEVRRLEPGQTSPQLSMRKDADQITMDSIAGVNEQTMNGELPSGNVAAVTFQKAQNQAIGRIRLKDRLLQHYSMKLLGELVASLILNHWSQEKILRLRADNGKIEEYYFNPLDMENLEYQVEMSPGSMAGVDKEMLNNFYYALLSQGHIDINDFLAVAELPKKDVLLGRLEEKVNNQAAQAAQQYEQVIADLQAQMEQMKLENIKLKGAHDLKRSATMELLSGDEKKIFDNQSKQSVIDNLISSEEMGIIPEVQTGAMSANPNNEGMIL